MDIEKIKQNAKNVLREVLKRLHSRDYDHVLEVVDEIEIGMDGLIAAMGCINVMIDPEDNIDELLDDEEIRFLEVTKGTEYMIDYELKSCGDGLSVQLQMDFFVSETGVKSVLRTIDI